MTARTDAPVVVVGEALVDVLPDRVLPGGAPVNVAVGAARLGVPTCWVGPLAGDEFGQIIRRHLADAGVDLSRALAVTSPTSSAVVTLDDNQPSYTFHLDGTGNRDAEVSAPDVGDAAAVVIVGGAIAFDDPPFGTSMAAMVPALPAPVWFDPNVRPGAPHDPGSYRTVLDSIVAGCTVVKASDEDLRLLASAGDAPLDLARAWASSGPSLVVLTRGPAGLVALRPGGAVVEVPGLDVEVVDTVGAGDTVTAALVAWAHEHGCLDAGSLRALPDEAIADALTFAARASAITVTRPGADPPTRAELP